MNDLDSDLTSPDVLKALEMAEVKWQAAPDEAVAKGVSLEMRLAVSESAIVVEALELGRWEHLMLAVPADLDHAIPVWMEALEQRFNVRIEKGIWEYERGKYVITLIQKEQDEGYVKPVKVVASDLCEALAGAVVSGLQTLVKVGKPKAEETDDVRSPR